jgi:hypothetical protein
MNEVETNGTSFNKRALVIYVGTSTILGIQRPSRFTQAHYHEPKMRCSFQFPKGCVTQGIFDDGNSTCTHMYKWNKHIANENTTMLNGQKSGT